MSVQFGRWNFDGQSPLPGYIEKVSATLAPYGPDTDEAYSGAGVKILYRAFCTTKESWLEKQPYISSAGAVITWDGRLDNRAEIIKQVGGRLPTESTDVAVVAAAYDKWGDKCLAKLIGDWALSIWNPADRSLLLAKDPIGTRHLYYSSGNEYAAWSTILDPLVLYAGRNFDICEEYVAGFFSLYPAPHVTPYAGIDAVPPSCFVVLRHGKRPSITRYWDFDPGKRIRYRTDAEYEEHFRSVLFTAVQRRLRSDRPVLAELSGGMDSSSIVCMADIVIARGAAECPRLDTISWYNDSWDDIEPDSNELHWISKVEAKLGRTGFHINFRELDLKEKKEGKQKCRRPFEPFGWNFDDDRLAAIPVPNTAISGPLKEYAGYASSQGYRVNLSGVAGESAMGADVPTPIPELQNLLVRARFLTLIRRLNAWAAKMRKPRLPLLKEAVQRFLRPAPAFLHGTRPAPWLDREFIRRNRSALGGYPFRTKLFGPLPSFQRCLAQMDGERKFMAFVGLTPGVLLDTRFPYLDRDLREFVYAIPREQIVGVGMRRFLMKRALTGIVPEELLNRRPKGFAPPEELMKETSTESSDLAQMGPFLVSSHMRIVDSNRFLTALRKPFDNREGFIGSLARLLELECWLRHLARQGVLRATATMSASSSVEVNAFQSANSTKSLAS